MRQHISSANIPAGGTYNVSFLVPAGTYHVRLNLILTGDATVSAGFSHTVGGGPDIPNDDAAHEIKTLGGAFTLSVEAGSGTAGLVTFHVFQVA